MLAYCLEIIASMKAIITLVPSKKLPKLVINDGNISCDVLASQVHPAIV